MLMDLLEKRRSIRKFAAKAVGPEQIDKLVEAALRSPSGKNSQPWEFIIVEEPQTIERLSNAKPHGAAFLKNAPLAMVVCADPEKSDTCVEDACIASIIIHLAAADLGLGSCWIQIRNRNHADGGTAQDYVKDVLGLPASYMVQSIIAIGYADEIKPPREKSSLNYARVHRERYGKQLCPPAGGHCCFDRR